jgi:hypothetical protein
MRARKFTVVGYPTYVYQFEYHLQTASTGRKEKLMAFPAGWRVLYRIR